MRKEWMEKDYYAELGVGKDADQKEIKKAFRKLARKFHPDNNPGDDAAESRFKEINEAYDTIGNEETRKEYDHAREMGYFVGGPAGNQQYVRVEDLLGGGFGGGGSSQDLFGGLQDLFGGGRRQVRPHKGQDVAGSITLSFHEALSGPTKEFNVGPNTVKVKIPKGVADGTKVRVRGKGGPGANGGPSGDLYVEIRVGEHPIFGRSGKQDLTINVPVTYAEAALGAVINIPTLNGTTKIRVPAGTQPDTTMKLSGKGVETSKATGDLLVTIDVAVPKIITTEEKAALETLREAESEWNPRDHLGV
ncbi:MAG: DnaJ C-terminal domain-containing protein [Acidimicrobiia bacterium]|nr:MAG: DnaJ C-terminal domain-containing protein [Acidimicrobiia bacterium]